MVQRLIMPQDRKKVSHCYNPCFHWFVFLLWKWFADDKVRLEMQELINKNHVMVFCEDGSTNSKKVNYSMRVWCMIIWLLQTFKYNSTFSQLLILSIFLSVSDKNPLERNFLFMPSLNPVPFKFYLQITYLYRPRNFWIPWRFLTKRKILMQVIAKRHNNVASIRLHVDMCFIWPIVTSYINFVRQFLIYIDRTNDRYLFYFCTS